CPARQPRRSAVNLAGNPDALQILRFDSPIERELKQFRCPLRFGSYGVGESEFSGSAQRFRHMDSRGIPVSGGVFGAREEESRAGDPGVRAAGYELVERIVKQLPGLPDAAFKHCPTHQHSRAREWKGLSKTGSFFH